MKQGQHVHDPREGPMHYDPITKQPPSSRNLGVKIAAKQTRGQNYDNGEQTQESWVQKSEGIFAGE